MGSPEQPVAPLRGRGLKRRAAGHGANDGSRSLTGAWIETGVHGSQCIPRGCRSLTGAWIETFVPGFER